MIFNKDNNGASELQLATGSFYESDNFDRIASAIEAVEHDIAKVVGAPVFEAIRQLYIRDEKSAAEQQLVNTAQRAVGLMAVMRYSRLNDLSHETGGRKAKIDRENEARPFEWQLMRDERVHLEEYYAALSMLVDQLTALQLPEWTESYLCQTQQQLLISDSAMFSLLTGIDVDAWLYWRMVPLISEAQRYVRRNYGTARFGNLLALKDKASITEDELDLLEYARRACALKALQLFCRRTELTALPAGMMAVFSQHGAVREETVSAARMHDIARHWRDDADFWIDEMKTLRDQIENTDEVPHFSMPDNDPHNKYFLT